HEAVREMAILPGDGRVVVARPEGEHADLSAGFPNSYGTLGYALRLRIDLEPVRPFVRLRHLRFSDADACLAAMAEIAAAGGHDGRSVDFLDGTVFDPGELYLTLGTFTDTAPEVSDYTGRHIYYRSIRQRPVDHLTVADYLWRWDTDWFWCSRAFGVQHPLVRRLWPRRWRRSDVYHRLVRLDRRTGFTDRLDALRGRPRQERVIQDVELPLERMAEFLAWFDAAVGMRPVWLCPLRLRRSSGWPTYPLEPGTTYVNAGFWGAVPVGAEAGQA